MTNCSTSIEKLLAGRRNKVIVGHYGSGKTELAINLALELRRREEKVMLLDMDIVNPFFRSAEQKDQLIAQGVEVVYPQYALSGVDIPVLPAEMLRAFQQKEYRCVFDVGGDDDGAAALGRYFPEFTREPADVLFVINPFRPRSDTREKVMELIRAIEMRARISLIGLISNANLSEETDARHILEGRALVERIAQEAGLPIVCEAGLPKAVANLDGKYPVFPIERFLKPEWMD